MPSDRNQNVANASGIRDKVNTTSGAPQTSLTASAETNPTEMPTKTHQNAANAPDIRDGENSISEALQTSLEEANPAQRPTEKTQNVIYPPNGTEEVSTISELPSARDQGLASHLAYISSATALTDPGKELLDDDDSTTKLAIVLGFLDIIHVREEELM